MKVLSQSSVSGIGYLGKGKFKSSINNKKTIYYTAWYNMIKRCYDKDVQEKHPTYIGCSVSEEWLNFQVFAEWFQQNYKEGFELDKDILFKGNKIYSPETCCFVPQEINNLLLKSKTIRGEYPIGVTKKGNKFRARIKKGSKELHIGLYSSIKEAFDAYKKVKNSYIIELANKWKSDITLETYEALMNYQIKITD